MSEDVKNEVDKLGMSPDQYMTRLPETDRNNVDRLINSFKKVMKSLGRKGVLVAIGGTVDPTKPMPRKDIDIIIKLEPAPDDPSPTKFSSSIGYGMADFAIFSGISKQIAGDLGMEIQEDKPVISPGGYLFSDGKCILSPNEGTLIEIIRMPGRGNFNDFVDGERRSHMKRPYVLLAQTE